MDDIIFEKDYRETESAEYDKWCDEVFDRAVNCGMLKAYSEAMDKIPKIIVPEDKKNYEYLLERCDAFVKQHRGYIKGIVDYHRWHAEINMFLPFAEFDDLQKNRKPSASPRRKKVASAFIFLSTTLKN